MKHVDVYAYRGSVLQFYAGLKQPMVVCVERLG